MRLLVDGKHRLGLARVNVLSGRVEHVRAGIKERDVVRVQHQFERNEPDEEQ